MTVSAPVKLYKMSGNYVSNNVDEIKDSLDPDASRPRRSNETEYPRIRIKPLRDILPVLNLRRTIQPQVEIPVMIQERLQDIEDTSHLGEDKTTMTAGLALPQQSCQFLKLAAVILEERGVGEGDLEFDTWLMENRVELRILAQGTVEDR